MASMSGGRASILASSAKSEGAESPALQFEFRPAGKGKRGSAASAASTGARQALAGARRDCLVLARSVPGQDRHPQGFHHSG